MFLKPLSIFLPPFIRFHLCNLAVTYRVCHRFDPPPDPYVLFYTPRPHGGTGGWKLVPSFLQQLCTALQDKNANSRSVVPLTGRPHASSGRSYAGAPRCSPFLISGLILLDAVYSISNRNHPAGIPGRNIGRVASFLARPLARFTGCRVGTRLGPSCQGRSILSINCEEPERTH